MKVNKSYTRLTMLFHILTAAFQNNDSKAVKQTQRSIHAIQGGNGEFHPKRTKLKGWQKENKRCSFNKNR